MIFATQRNATQRNATQRKRIVSPFCHAQKLDTTQAITGGLFSRLQRGKVRLFFVFTR